MSDEHMIKVWRFWNAPQEYQDLSTNGGDEDWVAFIPDAVMKEEGGYISWCEDPGAFGVCEIDVYEVEGGQVRIGVHA